MRRDANRGAPTTVTPPAAHRPDRSAPLRRLISRLFRLMVANRRRSDRAAVRKVQSVAVQRENVFPEKLSKRVVGGHLLYAPVVTAVPGKLVFVSGILSRDQNGAIVGKGDMRRQMQQVFENITVALAAVGATWKDVVKRQTFTTDIDEFYKHVDVRKAIMGDALSTSTAVQVSRLSHPDFLIEVEVMAIISQ
jgi:enamine deaminase RidA (YjgF/YER057c/UK114 family)